MLGRSTDEKAKIAVYLALTVLFFKIANAFVALVKHQTSPDVDLILISIVEIGVIMFIIYKIKSRIACGYEIFNSTYKIYNILTNFQYVKNGDIIQTKTTITLELTVVLVMAYCLYVFNEYHEFKKEVLLQRDTKYNGYNKEKNENTTDLKNKQKNSYNELKAIMIGAILIFVFSAFLTFEKMPKKYELEPTNITKEDLFKTTDIIEIDENSESKETTKTIENISHEELFVQSYYEKIGKKDYEGAYNMLSPKKKQELPFAKVLDGYKNTKSTIVRTSFIATDGYETKVEVRIKSLDYTEITGEYIRQDFIGYWILIRYGEDCYLLDKSYIKRIHIEKTNQPDIKF